MDDRDALAAATLAAARCAALGRHEVGHYFAQYVEFERLFKEHRAAEAEVAANRQIEVLKLLNR